MAWEDIIADPEFQAQPEEVKLTVARNYFSKHIDADQSFIEAQGKDPALRDKVWGGFVQTVVPKERWNTSYSLDPTIKKNLTGFGEFVAGGVKAVGGALADAVSGATQPAPEVMPAEPEPAAQVPPGSSSKAATIDTTGILGTDVEGAAPDVAPETSTGLLRAAPRVAFEGAVLLPRLFGAGVAAGGVLATGRGLDEAGKAIGDVLKATSSETYISMSPEEKTFMEAMTLPFRAPEAASDYIQEKYPDFADSPAGTALLVGGRTLTEAVAVLWPFRGVIRGAVEPGQLYGKTGEVLESWSKEDVRSILRATDESQIDPKLLETFKKLPSEAKAKAIKESGIRIEQLDPSLLGRVLGVKEAKRVIRLGGEEAATGAAASRGLALTEGEAPKTAQEPPQSTISREPPTPSESAVPAATAQEAAAGTPEFYRGEAAKLPTDPAPVLYAGYQEGFGKIPGRHMFNQNPGVGNFSVLPNETVAEAYAKAVERWKPAEPGPAAPVDRRAETRVIRSGYPESQVPDLPTVESDIEAVKVSLKRMEGEYVEKKAKDSSSMDTLALSDRIKAYRDSLEKLQARKVELLEQKEPVPEAPPPAPPPAPPEKPLHQQARAEISRNLVPAIRVEGVGTYYATPGTTVHAGVDMPPEAWQAVEGGAQTTNGWWDHGTGQWLDNSQGRALVDSLVDAHRDAIRTALANGQHVPASVLADYPDLIPKPDPQPTEAEIVVPRTVPTTKELAERGGYLTDKDDLQGIIREHGDLITILKDANGGKAVIPLSLAIRILEDTVASGYVSTAAVRYDGAPAPGVFTLDEYTIPNMPAFAAALVRLFPERLAEFPASILEAGSVPPSKIPSGPEEAPEPLPLLAPEQVVAQGKPSWAITARGSRVDVQYIVVEADALVTSHGTNFKKNPAYPSELQPRSREREAMRQQIEGPQGIMAKLVPELLGESLKADDGAPIIGEDGVVESGNGRTIALKRLYEVDHANAVAYRNWLAQHAAQFGVDQIAIDEANRPVLVRMRTTPMNLEARKKFAAEANQTLVAEMSPTEKAMGDAARMSDDLMTQFVPDEEGNVNTAANRVFISRFMEEVVGPDRGQYLMGDGRSWNDAGIKRVRNAVFARAYGNVDAVVEIIESADVNIKNIGNAMLAVAPRMAQVASEIAKGNLYDLNLGGAVAEAAVKMSALRKATPPLTVEMFLSQYGLFGRDITDDGVAMLRLFDANKRSAKKITAVLNRYLNLTEGAGSPNQLSMFGKTTPPSKLELLQRAQAQVAQETGEDQGPGLFRDRPAPGKTVKMREAVPAEGEQPTAPVPETPTRSDREEFLNQANVELGGVNDLLPEIIDLPELVGLAKALLGGKYPRVVQYIGKGTLGMFSYKGEGVGRGAMVQILASLWHTDMKTGLPLGEDVGLMRAKMTLAHEIGHVMDWLPDFIIHGRGNILGRIASLRKYLDDMIQSTPKDMEALISEDERKELLKQAGKEARKNIPPLDRKTASAAERKERLKEVAKEMQKLYAKKLAEEASRRKLITRDEIMKELKDLSMDWKPFDTTLSPRFTAYRFSSPELYADSMSVLMNDPNRLARIAPKFYESWKAWLESKPEVKSLYEQIQKELKTGKLPEARQAQRMENYERGERTMAAKRTKETTTYQDVVSLLKRELVDTNTGVIHRVKSSGGTIGGSLAPENNPIYWIEEMIYSSAEARAFLGAHEAILKALNEAGVSWEQLGSYLEDRRIIAERRQMANPEGITPQAALESIRLLKKQLGEQKWMVLNEQAQEFRDAHRYIVDEYRKAEMVGPELQRYMEANAHYVTFAVEAYYSANYGSGITAHVFKQHGTFANILNPATATLMKDIAMLKAKNRKMAAIKTAQFLQEFFPGEIRPAERVWNGRRRVPLPPKDPKQSLLIFPHQGKLAAFYVPKEVGRTFEQNSAEASVILDAGRWMNQAFRELFVQKNPGFWLFNIVRDTKRAAINLPGATAWKMMPYFYRALTPAFRRAFNIADETVDAMERGKMLISVEDPWAINTEDKQVEAMLRRFERGDKATRNIHDRTWRKFFGWMDAVGHAVEINTKIASYSFLKDLKDAEGNPLFNDKEIGHMVRVFAGSPDFMRKGSAYPIYNNMLLFSNAIKEGFRGDYEAVKMSPAEWWWKNTKYNLIPKLLMYAGVIGLMGHEIKKLYENVSKYDLSNYHVIPLGRTKDGQASVVLRIPMDETGRFIGGTIWKALTVRKAKDVADLFDFMAGQAPNLSPAIGIPVQVLQYSLGQNPYDWFRGRYMIDDLRFKAGGWPSHREFLKQLSNEAGLGLIYRFETQEPRAAKNELEKTLRYPIVSNIIGRFIKVTDQGQREKFREVTAEQQQIQATRGIAIRDAIVDDLSSERPRGPTNVATDLMKKGVPPGTKEEFNAKYQSAIVRIKGSPAMAAFVKARSKEEKAAVLLQVLKGGQ